VSLVKGHAPVKSFCAALRLCEYAGRRWNDH
jgi:hypothetical protein